MTPNTRHPRLHRCLNALATLAAGLGTAMAALAAPIYLIDATTDGLPPDPGFANVAFSLTYEDVNLDLHFSIDELLAFTGFSDAQSGYFGVLESVPDAPGITGNGLLWAFGDGQTSIGFAPDTFTPFAQALTEQPLPLPGTMLLSAAGLALLARRRGAAAQRRAAVAGLRLPTSA